MPPLVFFPWGRKSKYKAKPWWQINDSNVFTSPITTAATKMHPPCLNMDEWEIKVLKMKKLTPFTSCTLSNILLHKQVPEKTSKIEWHTSGSFQHSGGTTREKSSSVGLSSAQKHSSTSVSVSCLQPVCLDYGDFCSCWSKHRAQHPCSLIPPPCIVIRHAGYFV